MRVTGSKVHRVWKCPASAVLPQSGAYQPELEPFLAKGKAVHAFLHRAGKVERAVALAEAPKDVLPLCEALQLEDLPVGLGTEVSYAWNWVDGSARELGRDLPLRPGDGGVDYDHPSIQPPVDWTREIPLTLDVVGVAVADPGGPGNGERVEVKARGYVGDYKSGHTKYPAPDKFGQTLLGALCIANLYGCDDVVVELINIHDDGGHHSVRRTVNTWDLQAFADELQEAMDRLTTAQLEGWPNAFEDEPAPVEGPWCDYCSAYKNCPQKIALVRAIPQELVQLGVRPGQDPSGPALEVRPGAITVRNAAAAWEAIERIEDVLGRAKAEICGIASFEDVPLSDGRVIGRIVTEKRKANGRIAAQLLEQRYGRKEMEERVDISVTLGALRQAVVANIKQGQKIETKKGDGEYDKLIAELDRIGGLETKVTEAIRPHVPKKKPG